MSNKPRKKQLPFTGTEETLWSAALSAHAAGDYPTAEKLYSKYLRKHSGHREALHKLALIAQEQGNYERAKQLYEKITTSGPAKALYHNNYATLLFALNDYEYTANQALKAIHADKQYAPAYNSLGAALEHTGNLDQAMVCFSTAIELDPEDFRAYNNLGRGFREKDDHKRAIDCFRQALAINPNYSLSHLNLAAVLLDSNEPETAAQHLVEALRLDPNVGNTYNNLSEALKRLGRTEAALAALRIAVNLRDNDPRMLWNLALLELINGNLARGWDLYEHGISAGERGGIFDFGIPVWDGSSLEGKSIVVSAEQGLGDEMIYASCLPEIISQAARCVVTCDSRLAPLYTRSFPGIEFFPSRIPVMVKQLAHKEKFDYQIAVGSLPRYFRRSLDQFPKKNSYLVPDVDKSLEWKQRLDKLPRGIKVGVNWRSRNQHITRQSHYITLDQLLPVFNVHGLTFVNLQYDNCTSELEHLKNTHGVVLHNFEDLDQFNDLDNVAALISQLDLVVCVGTAVSVIAGAVGTKTFKLAAVFSELNLGTDHEPWFPSVRVFPGAPSGDWSQAIELLTQNLENEKEPGY